jgi:hypothetical protein
MKSFPKKEIEKMVREAVEISERLNETLIENSDLGKSVVKSVSEKKIRPKKDRA